MIVKLAVSKAVRDMIDYGYTVIKAKTNFDTPPSKEAYQIIKDMSKFDNFFFSFRVNELGCLDSMDCNLMYCDDGAVLTLDVPDDKTFSSGYYNFSDLIYQLDCAGEDEKDEDYIKYLSTECLKGSISDEEQRKLTCGLVQVLFEEIHLDWIKSIEYN